MIVLLGILLILCAVGILVAKKPVYAALSFLATLMLLAAHYLILSAEFIAVIQILVYAGAILVIFIFVMMIFQDAYRQIHEVRGKGSPLFIAFASAAFIVAVGGVVWKLGSWPASKETVLPVGFGNAASIGKSLYIDFFFPFEAVLLLFLIGMVGAVFIARKEK